MIEFASKFIPEGEFEVNEAIKLDTNTKYDFVISNGVFYYFKSLDYAEEVIKRMFSKALKKIAIFDINDEEKRDLAHKIKSAGMTEEEYKKRYEGLDQLFCSKEWFIEIGKKLNAKTSIWDQDFKNYENSKFRFNVMFEKE